MKETRKERLLTIALLKERLERVSGKKVMFKEGNTEDVIAKLKQIAGADSDGIAEDQQLSTDLVAVVDKYGNNMWDAVMDLIDAAQHNSLESRHIVIVAKKMKVAPSKLVRAVSSYYSVLKRAGKI